MKPITADYLRAVTAAYLEKYSASAGHLKRLLMRRIVKAEFDRAEGERLVDAEVARVVALGWVDDQRYAEARARRLREKGASAAKIRADLAGRRLGSEAIDAAVDKSPDAEWEAARTWARKRRIGPWRTGEADRAKELAKLGRAGFSYDVARRIVDADE